MFCYQCEQSINGGCTKVGVCGKTDEVSNLQDLLIYVMKGLASIGKTDNKEVTLFLMDGLFSTLTNVNFDEDRFYTMLYKSKELRVSLLDGMDTSNMSEHALYELPETEGEMLHEAEKFGIMADSGLNEDIRSLRELLIYGLKGLAAYAHHAYVLGKESKEVYDFMYKGLAATLDDNLTAEELTALNMELGRVNFICMELLDSANTDEYGHPEPTKVNINKVKGPFIVISGHDLKDMKELLEQTKGTGVNVYTHGEMLPGHAYPELKKYDHLVGNLGGAWQDQQKEFDNLPGAILMTTNCIQKPKNSYSDRIFTTSVVGFEGLNHVDEKKDFSALIEKAKELGGFTETEEPKEILVGFGRNAVLSNADKVIEGVKSGDIKHFFLIGGCDGVKHGRNYYTELATSVPDDSIIMTLACGKYRFNKLEFGTIGELPRLLDIGQCNDAFSAIKIALALSEAFDCDVNELPLSIVLSWYEQKAVVILLTLLSLGIKGMYIGPTLPKFMSENVVKLLVENFDLTPTGDVETDLANMLGN
ncbi:MAG: hydroxylamine reductase [Clostridia bacterium]|nr:hydroxylamine reductase [Clostridia bacterium]